MSKIEKKHNDTKCDVTLKICISLF